MFKFFPQDDLYLPYSIMGECVLNFGNSFLKTIKCEKYELVSSLNESFK
jgi:hypothetical protein